ncbi:MAG: endonuclease/exonuclease/phosphatase family protein [Gemmatimonadota bacterium]|nr:endonuclease/exonuclease/phosphatase family protein [Gemmatimonadota bacterium]
MATVRVRCTCGQQYLADTVDAGKGIRCRCGRVVPIPAATGSSPRPKGSGGSSSRHRARAGKSSGHREGTKSPKRSRRISLRKLLRLPRLTFPAWVRPAVTVSNWLYLAGVIASALLLWLLGDRWWPATVLTYGPRWLLLVPAIPLAAATLLVRPRFVALTLAATILTLGPVMGYRLGWRTWFRHRGKPSVRLVTFNVMGASNPMILAVPGELARLDADVMLFQECPEELVAAAKNSPLLAGWTVRKDGTLCLASRWPVDSVRVMEEVRTRDQGGTGAVVFYSVQHPTGAFGLANVHLETPGKGLAPLRYGGETGQLVRNVMLRDVGSRRAGRWIIGQHFEPLIAGDFNQTVESAIYRAYWDGCPNAFSRVGRGFGWTRVLNRFSARIDHVITCGSWTATWAEVGPDLGSDHRPLVVDLTR